MRRGRSMHVKFNIFRNMKLVSEVPGKYTLYGLLTSLLAGIVYYLFFTPVIVEFRTIMTVSSDVYERSAQHIQDYGAQLDDRSFFFSPNFESIADTLTDAGIRRFEMREYYVSTSDKNKIREKYYSVFKMSTPKIIFEKKFGERKSIGTALSIVIVGAVMTLLIFSTWQFLTYRKKQNEK